MFGIKAVTVLCLSGAFVFGMLLALLGSLKLALAGHLEPGEGRARRLLSALNLALIPLMLLSGTLVDHWSVLGMMVVGSVALALALLALSVRPTYPRALAVLLLAGVGGAALNTASVVLMPLAFFGTQADYAASLNLGFVFFALGALVALPLTEVLLHTAGLRRTLALLAFLCLIPAVLAALPDLGALSAAPGPGISSLLDRETVWLAGLVFFFYAPLEAAVSVWVANYLGDPDSAAYASKTSHRAPSSRRLLWSFWSAFLAGRLLAAVGQHAGFPGERWDGWVLVLWALFAAVVLGNLSGSGRRGYDRMGVMILGLLLGPILPTLVALVFRRFPGEMGTTYGTLFALGSLGSLILAPLVGVFGDRARHPSTSGLRLPTLLALALTAATLVFVLVALS